MNLTAESGYILKNHPNCNDKRLVSECIAISGSDIFKYASDELKSDREFIIQQLNIVIDTDMNGYIIKHCSSEIKKDREIALLALKTSEHVFLYLDSSLRSDRQFIKHALSINGCIIQHVDKEYKMDKELVEIALISTPRSIKFVSNVYYKDNFNLMFQLLFGNTQRLQKEYNNNPKNKLPNSRHYSDQRLVTYINEMPKLVEYLKQNKHLITSNELIDYLNNHEIIS